MTSFDRRLNSLYAIKECSSCGALYTANCGCSEGSLEDKILVPIPESSQRPLKIERICLDCGDPVHGLYCRRCTLTRKTLEELFLQFTSESSDDNTNVVNAPREPFVVKQDPGNSQSPPQIDHCCHECGDSLDEIFCQRCTCKSCGKGAHIGYNCPTQTPIITNAEPCNNRTVNELPQASQSLQQQCLFHTCQQCGCNEYDGVCFYCKVGNGTPINVSTPHSSNDSPKFSNHPTHYEPILCDFYGNDARYVIYCTPPSSKSWNHAYYQDYESSTNSPRSDLYHEEFADELTHIMSLPNLECFKFKIEPDPGDLTSIDPGIRKNVSTTNVNVPLEDDQSSLFAYVVWIFLAFLTYPVVPPYLLSTGNEDTIFDPGISSYHSCMPDVSHRNGTFMKFNDCPDCDDSRARGFVLRSLELHILGFILGIRYPNLID
ncbi:hypothetical protein Tco_1302884 [Tanacetum coccineum]